MSLLHGRTPVFCPVTLSHPLLLHGAVARRAVLCLFRVYSRSFRDRGAASRPLPAPLRPRAAHPVRRPSLRPTPPPLTSRPESSGPHPVLHHQPLPFWLPAAPQPPLPAPAGMSEIGPGPAPRALAQLAGRRALRTWAPPHSPAPGLLPPPVWKPMLGTSWWS